MDHRSRNNRDDVPDDQPMYSRLFIVCDRSVVEESFREAFETYGEIEDIKILKTKNGDSKGVCFIKFAKTSEAAKALEGMNMKVMPNTRRPLKVMVATNRTEVQSNDDSDDKYRRLFIHIPRNMNEDELESTFKTYGRLQSVVIQRDRNTGDSKGFAYVTFSKFSEAAFAFEECERKYRPVFAAPKWQRRPETVFESSIDMWARSSNSHNNSLVSLMEGPSRGIGFTCVNFMCCPDLNQRHVETLFDIVPGMVSCKYFVDLVRNVGKGAVLYSNPAAAAHAVEKLNEFEYPPGLLIYVRPDNSSFVGMEPNYNNVPNAVSKLRNAIESSNKSGNPNLAQLAEAIAEASKFVKMATGATTDDIPDSNDMNYCSVKLPDPQPLAHIDSPLAKRCFLICKPAPPPLTVLRDVFCRFGNLINVYTLPNRTVGFARFASVSAADEAIRVLHGAEICGVRMKVVEAEEEAPPKKRRFDSEY